MNRDTFIRRGTAALTGLLLLSRNRAQAVGSSHAPGLATGVKVGEITPTSALVWVRLTREAMRRAAGDDPKIYILFAPSAPPPADPGALLGACAGAPGSVRVIYGETPDLAGAAATPWREVETRDDFAAHLALTQLRPGTRYRFAVETRAPDGRTPGARLTGEFATAPVAATPAALTFCVVTCQAYAHLDDPAGFNIYPAMQRLAPAFVVFTGDTVYYDTEEPRAVNAALARYHWERMLSLPRHRELLRVTPAYWMKDDHDTLADDCYPAQTGGRAALMGELTFAQGQEIFRQQTPVTGLLYRSFRWGRDLEVWFVDGRDYRTPNPAPDSPQKTILGAEQKAWLKRTLLASDATWKVLVSATPVVGPDRANKNDSHANEGYAHEGGELRAWVREHLPAGLVCVCGDRHWQYHSVHPDTGLHEFCSGPASNAHADGSPGEKKDFHRFHRMKGGFLSVSVAPAAGASTVTLRHHDVHGAVVHEWRETRSVVR